MIMMVMMVVIVIIVIIVRMIIGQKGVLRSQTFTMSTFLHR